MQQINSNKGIGNSITPPYKFEYYQNNLVYNQNNADSWGYLKVNPESWSLKKITTPTGANLSFEYESDSFLYEAIKQSNSYTDFNHRINEASVSQIESYVLDENRVKLNFNTGHSQVSNTNFNSIFYLNQELDISYSGSKSNYNGVFTTNIKYKVIGINNTLKTLDLELIENSDYDNHVDFLTRSSRCVTCGGGFSSVSICYVSPPNSENKCLSHIKLRVYNFQNLITFGSNGKKGGGIRIKQLALTDSKANILSKTTYTYNDPFRNNISGVTSYEPSDTNNTNYFGKEELISPNVMYKYVTVSTFNNLDELTNKNVYEFNVLENIYLDEMDITLRTSCFSLSLGPHGQPFQHPVAIQHEHQTHPTRLADNKHVCIPVIRRIKTSGGFNVAVGSQRQR